VFLKGLEIPFFAAILLWRRRKVKYEILALPAPKTTFEKQLKSIPVRFILRRSFRKSDRLSFQIIFFEQEGRP